MNQVCTFYIFVVCLRQLGDLEISYTCNPKLLQREENEMHNKALYSEILNILRPFNVPAGAHNRILNAYCESWRTYHNADHIIQMLRLSRHTDINLSDEERQRLELMILYHDVWYKVGRSAGENEKQSAQWAVDDLAGASDELIRLRRCLQQGINATATHSLADTNPVYVDEIATLLDLDLWGLGQEPESFQEDTEKVWQEYQPIATREEFDNGRSIWAQNFLSSRNQIYFTEPFLDREEMAQRNLKQLVG